MKFLSKMGKVVKENFLRIVGFICLGLLIAATIVTINQKMVEANMKSAEIIIPAETAWVGGIPVISTLEALRASREDASIFEQLIEYFYTKQFVLNGVNAVIRCTWDTIDERKIVGCRPQMVETSKKGPMAVYLLGKSDTDILLAAPVNSLSKSHLGGITKLAYRDITYIVSAYTLEGMGVSTTDITLR